MGRAFETIMGIVTAPSTTLTALTMQDNDSLTVRSVKDTAKINLRQAWTLNQTAGAFRIRSPRLHDIGDCMLMAAPAANPHNLLNTTVYERLYPQDVLAAHLSGSGTAGDIEMAALLIEYEDLEGIQQRLITPDELSRRFEHLMSVRNTITTGTAGAYGTAEAINAEFGSFKPNTDYAVLGYATSADAVVVAYRSVETGNLRYAGPGNADDIDQTREFFIDNCRKYGGACIPVFNAANVANFLVNAAVDENGADPVVTTFLAQLRP